jgi:hypothetical protein
MGRTISKFHDDDDRKKKSTKPAKHSKNIPGQGMRVINNWSEEEDYDEYEDSDDEYYENTSQTQRK